MNRRNPPVRPRRRRIKGAALLAGLLLLSPGAFAEPGPARLAEFPLIFYSVDGLSREKMRDARDLGATVIHTYRLGHSFAPEELAWERRYLDQAQALGLRVMVNLNGGQWIDDPRGREHLRTIVRHLKDHPALAFWYLYDEPDGNHSPEQVRPLYELLRRETPGVPVAICSAWTRHWADYTPVLDLTMVDIYPVYDEPFPHAALQHVTHFTHRAIQAGKPVIPVLQIINWRCFAKPGQTEYRGHSVARLRYPEARELRYWIYGCLAQGHIAGLAFWSYYHGARVDPRWMRDTLPPLLRELKEFTRLTAPVDQPRVFAVPPEARLRLAAWDRPAGRWLLLVNDRPEEREIDCRFTPGTAEKGNPPPAEGARPAVEAHFLASSAGRAPQPGALPPPSRPFANARLTPWGNTRSVNVSLDQGHLRVHARPWEVFIWQVAPRDAPGAP